MPDNTTHDVGADAEELLRRVNAYAERIARLEIRVGALARYEASMGGCGDPECCGSYPEMEAAKDGEWVRFDDVRNLMREIL